MRRTQRHLIALETRVDALRAEVAALDEAITAAARQRNEIAAISIMPRGFSWRVWVLFGSLLTAAMLVVCSGAFVTVNAERQFSDAANIRQQATALEIEAVQLAAVTQSLDGVTQAVKAADKLAGGGIRIEAAARPMLMVGSILLTLSSALLGGLLSFVVSEALGPFRRSVFSRAGGRIA